MDKQPANKQRENMLILFFVVVVGGAAAVLLYFLTLGFFGHVMVVVVALMLLAPLHYSLWGHAMTKEVAGEKQEQELQERLERGESWERNPGPPDESYEQHRY